MHSFIVVIKYVSMKTCLVLLFSITFLSKSSAITCNVEDGNGYCFMKQCAPGFLCDVKSNRCCPNLEKTIGPCMNGGCPNGIFYIKKMA